MSTCLKGPMYPVNTNGVEPTTGYHFMACQKAKISTELQIREGIDDNSKVIVLIPPYCSIDGSQHVLKD